MNLDITQEVQRFETGVPQDLTEIVGFLVSDRTWITATT
jgi:hypothetical protein